MSSVKHRRKLQSSMKVCEIAFIEFFYIANPFNSNRKIKGRCDEPMQRIINLYKAIRHTLFCSSW